MASYLKGEKPLHVYLHHQVPMLRETHNLEAVMRLRDWLTSRLCYSGLELVIPHAGKDADTLMKTLLRYEGGLWCAGAAELFAMLLREIRVPATTFIYGYQGIESLSHMTTIVCPIENASVLPRFYLLDSYLGFHYADAGSGRMLDLSELLSRVRDRRYSEIQRVDIATERVYVTKEGDGPEYRRWLFDHAAMGPHQGKGTWIYGGATYTVPKLFMDGTPMRKLADQKRGDQPLEEYLLDLMFVQPQFGDLTLSARDGQYDTYTSWSLMEQLVSVMAECCARRPL